MGKESSVCLGCSKKFSKTDTSVQCTVCGLWIHTVCANMSSEVFELLDKQKRESGITYWACRPCTAFAQGMNHRLKQICDDLKEVKQTTSSNTEAIKKLEEKVEDLTDKVTTNTGINRQEFEERMKEEREEMRERKDRELNIVVHGIEECDAAVTEGEERLAWDVQRCLEMINNMNIRANEDDVKFCRRVGARGERERPLVVGLYNSGLRNKILRARTDGTASVGRT
jgi:hypothetical protein